MTQICPSPSATDIALGGADNVQQRNARNEASTRNAGTFRMAPPAPGTNSASTSVTRNDSSDDKNDKRHFLNPNSRYRSNNPKRRAFPSGTNYEAGPSRPKRHRIELPTKFLLGGNINDPLNLNGLASGETSTTSSPQETPKTSPLPSSNTPLEIIIPKNKRDPLNLNDASTKSQKLKLRKRRRRTNSLRLNLQEAEDLSRRSVQLVHGFSSHGARADGSVSDSEVTASPRRPCKDPLISPPLSRPKNMRLQSPGSTHRSGSIVHDPIVSPVTAAIKNKLPDFRAQVSRDSGHGNTSDRDLPIRTGSPRKDSPKKFKRRDRNPSQRQKLMPPRLPQASDPFNQKMDRFKYGNYSRYYGYRLSEHDHDPRLKLFRAKWFEAKQVLDIGCNTGHITCIVARLFQPTRAVGIDIDSQCIGVARKNLRQYLDELGAGKSMQALAQLDEPGSRPTPSPTKGAVTGKMFPPSFAKTYGPLSAPVIDTGPFPSNVVFEKGNYVLESDELLSFVKPEYDVIMALSITKWIHLNWGDVGMKRFFLRVFRNLNPGGIFLLEPQPFESYKKRKKLTSDIRAHYDAISFKPIEFIPFLVNDVGFVSSECLGVPLNKSKGFRRPLFLLRKPEEKSIIVEESTTSIVTIESALV